MCCTPSEVARSLSMVPLMKSVGVIVNVEARGASGPSMMFETGVGNARLMDLFAGAVARPSANSVTYEVYRLLPNDTDFSVYRKLGLTGFNFAYSNSASLYHSARDNLQYIDRKSLQHHGEHAFEVTRVLADADLAALKSSSDASYFDAFGRTMVVWPAALNLPLALLALAGIAGLIVVHRAAFTLRGTIWAIGATVAVPLLLFGIGWLLSYPLGIWPAVHPLDHPYPWPGRVATLTAALFAALVVAAVFSGRAEARALLLVNWLVLALIAAGVAYGVTGASFPFLWPALAFAAIGWTETLLRRRSLAIAAWAGFFGITFFLISFALALELVLGFHLTQYKILVLMPVVLALVPVLSACLAETSAPAWFLSGVSAAVVMGAAAIASQTPAYAPNHPRGLNIIYYDDKETRPRWLIGFIGLPDEAYLKAQAFPAADVPYKQLGLLDDHGRFKAATDAHLAAPALSAAAISSADGATTLRGTMRSGRSGVVMGIGFAAHAGIRSIRLDGQEVLSPEKLKGGDPTVTRFWGLGSREVPIEITYDSTARPTITLYELSPLPTSEEARALVAGRPDDAAPAYRGDTSVVFTAVDLAGLKAP